MLGLKVRSVTIATTYPGVHLTTLRYGEAPFVFEFVSIVQHDIGICGTRCCCLIYSLPNHLSWSLMLRKLPGHFQFFFNYFFAHFNVPKALQDIANNKPRGERNPVTRIGKYVVAENCELIHYVESLFTTRFTGRACLVFLFSSFIARHICQGWNISHQNPHHIPPAQHWRTKGSIHLRHKCC